MNWIGDDNTRNKIIFFLYYNDNESIINQQMVVINENDRPSCQGLTQKGCECKIRPKKGHIYCKRHEYQCRFPRPVECPICMESLDQVRIPLSCSHWIHPDCIVKWGKEQCPVCRQSISLPWEFKFKLRQQEARKRKQNFLSSFSIERDENDIRILPIRVSFAEFHDLFISLF